jgi:hypothetical protein
MRQGRFVKSLVAGGLWFEQVPLALRDGVTNMLLLFNQLMSFVNRYIDIFFRRNLTATQ